jgi:allantoinase
LKLLDKGDFLAAWGGISSVQLGLSLFWSSAQRRGFSVADVNKFLSVGPAKLAGLADRKGQIKEGFDADFVIWDPHASFVVRQSDLEHKNKVTPYLGKCLNGVVRKTILRGEVIFDGARVGNVPQGKFLLK